MSEWIHIPAENLIESHRAHPGTTLFFRSPFDIPVAVRPVASGSVVTLELRYLDNEERVEKITANERVSFEIGRHSKRLFKITVDTSKSDEELLPLLEDALNQLRAVTKAPSTENYDATSQAIAQQKAQIVQQLAPATP